MATPPVLKPLKIKTGTCRRVLKELRSYEKEVERETAKTASMRESGADPFDIKQQENVLVESRMMVPETRKRLESALYDLEAILAEAEEDETMSGTEELQAAKDVIADVKPCFN